MSRFTDFLSEVKDGTKQIAVTQAKQFADAVIEDGQAFLGSLEDDLKTWTQQLASGQLSPKDFAFLVRGKEDLAKMSALTEAGMAAIQIDSVRSALVALIITAAGKMV